MEPYKKNPFEDFSDRGLEEIASYDFPIPNDAEERIIELFQKKKPTTHKRIPRKWMAACIAAVITLGLVGFTNIDRIVQLYNKYLGVSTDVTQYADSDTITTVNSGIRVNCISTVRDDNTLYMFVDFIDETESYSDSLSVTDWNIIFDDKKETVFKNAIQLEYSQDKKTTTYLLMANVDKTHNQATVNIKNFITDYTEILISGNWSFNIAIPNQMKKYNAQLDQKIEYGIGYASVEQFTVSPLGMDLFILAENIEYKSDIQVNAIYKNGSKVAINKISEVITTGDGNIGHNIKLGPIVDFNSLNSIEINGVKAHLTP